MGAAHCRPGENRDEHQFLAIKLSEFSFFTLKFKQTMDFSGFKFNEQGLIPAIIQEAADPAGTVPPAGRVLMMAWMNRDAIEKTLSSGRMHYWSRSRQKSWFKGETSGHIQIVRRWAIDCDGDTLLFEVEQHGGACHTGYHSCFFQLLDNEGRRLPVVEAKDFDPHQVYTA